MTGTSEQTTPQEPTPVVIPADPPKTPADAETFCKDKKPGCSSSYDDIIYVTGQRRFWLLPKRTSEKLKESVSLLKQKTVDADKATRMSNIADAGLMEYFLTPGPEAFLEGEQRSSYLASKSAIPEDTTKKAQCRKDWEAAKAKGDSDATMHAEREMFHAGLRIEKNQKNMETLEKVSDAKAKTLGYKRENGIFYTPRALKAREAIDKYIEERDKAKAHGYKMFDPGTKKIASAWEHLKDYKALYKKLIETGEVDKKALRGVQLNILALKDLMSKYINSIVELAECGIAVPEFALSPDDQYAGTEDFQAFVELTTKRDELEKKIEDRYSHWVSATGGKSAPPGVLFAKLRDQWYELNTEAERIQTTAEARVREIRPPRMFLWEPETYKPKPIERLAKTNIPLRELSSASSTTILNHISLKHLAQVSGNAFKGQLKELATSLPKSIAKEADDDRVFSDWLNQEGALQFDEKGPWFDEHGLFVPDKFFAALEAKGYRVESIRAEDKRKRWGENLKAMVFEDKQLRNLMLFDNSPQAQLVRCLLPEGANLLTEVKMEGPTWKNGAPQIANVEVALDVTAWRGEVTLLKVELPKRVKAEPWTAKYKAHDGSIRSVNFGKLSLDLEAKAWGFAGASLMLSRDLSLDQKTGYTSLVGVDVAEKTGEVGKYEVFAGAQAGCKVTGKLFWCPPPGVLPPAPVPNRLAANQWRPLAKLEVEMAVAVGAGISGDLNLRVHDGRLLLSIKGALVWGAGVKGYLTFEVGYESIVALTELVRQEMAANQYKDLEWVETEALAYVKKLSFLGATGIDVAFAYVRGYAIVKEIFDALTQGDRGGQIAYTIVRDKNQQAIQEWVYNLPPQALGPLLLALSAPPKEFTAEDEEKNEFFDEEQTHLLQQRSIEKCLTWISTKKNSSHQFEEAIICMNRDGARPSQAGQTYCKNKLKLDSFMTERVLALQAGTNEMRARYRSLVSNMGARLNSHCDYQTEYKGPAFAPIQKIKSTYKGPNID
ncbi:type II toxin-antitoxin system RelE/ParE family toxin [Pseudomonas glycinae]|uniref:type II toxin-antitoxin system RelE/ParE family toxin n=1 Tax=Pseudomonas glycinae TaxID=1785145 RepID=UPI002B1D73B9|nr:type II toxin-antitoxin system RelE/ParE family toxin [Pseudomonas glycinae]